MSEHDRNTATIDRDLAAIEDALANGMAAHDDPSARELQELALALRADAPEPDPGFARELRTRAAEGSLQRRGRRRRAAPRCASASDPGGRGGRCPPSA